MIKAKILLLVGIIAYLGFLFLQLPIARALPWLPPQIHVYSATGTITAGNAELVQWRDWRFEKVSWQLQPGSLLTGRLAFAVAFHNADESRGHAEAGVSLQQEFSLTNPHAHLKIKALAPAWPMATNLDGWLTADLAYLTWSRTARSLAGRVTVENVALGGKSALPIGDFVVDLDTKDQTIIGQIADRNALLAVAGQVTLDPKGAWQLNATLAPRAKTPPQISRMLAFLPPPDASGQYSLSLGGRLGER